MNKKCRGAKSVELECCEWCQRFVFYVVVDHGTDKTFRGENIGTNNSSYLSAAP